ncbi:MAG: molybdopterin biosynthesis protein [Thermoplasmata archaeon]
MKVFHKLVSVEEARNIISRQIEKMREEKNVSIEDAAGMISSSDVFSAYDIPPFDRSEVDGYAVMHEDVEMANEDNAVRLKISGRVMAGDSNIYEIRKGNAIYISTGALIPRGADAVVMVEDTREREDSVDIYRSVYPGENISFAGTDFSMGDLIVNHGTILTPERIAVAAAAGNGKIKVFRPLKIGIFSTGNEVKKPGDDLDNGQIFDTNGHYFLSTFSDMKYINAEYLGIIRDNEESMLSFLSSIKEKYDVIMASGSTSAGFYDLLYRVVERSGGHILFHGINIKPGKPAFFATMGNHAFMGMPGFPLSSAIVLRYVFIPAVTEALLSGGEKSIRVRIPFRINGEKAQDSIIPAIIARNGLAYPVLGNSGSISRIVHADGLIVIPGNLRYVDKGEEIEFIPFNTSGTSIISIGSSDPIMDRIIYSSDRNAKIINTGSWGGVSAMKDRESDISGIHILKDGVYNLSVMDENLRSSSYLIRGFRRKRGFLSKNGIDSFDRIMNDNLIFVNRNRGSGTRDLIEEMIGKRDDIRRNMRGYMWETNTEAGVARAVLQGRADAGISLEYYAIKLGLKYVNIKEESYDILISKSFYESEMGREFIKNLKKAKDYENDFPGYVIPDDIGEILS